MSTENSPARKAATRPQATRHKPHPEAASGKRQETEINNDRIPFLLSLLLALMQ
jgi:hypothetical protein